MKARDLMSILALTATQSPASPLAVMMDGLVPHMDGATWCFLKLENKQWSILSAELATVGRPKWVEISEGDIEIHLVTAHCAGIEYKNEDAKEVVAINHCVDDYPLYLGHSNYGVAA